MIQLIGLIVGIYCTCRMIQIPLEMANTEKRKVFGMPDDQRLRVVLILSGFATVVLFLLTLAVLFWSTESLPSQLQ
jgi:hypothetical protein